MKHDIVSAAAAALFLAPAAFAGTGEEQAKLLEGTWAPASAELAGTKFSDEVLKSMKMVLKGSAYTVTVAGNPDRGTFKIDPANKPCSIDVTGTEGPNKGKTFPAIYELTKDSLKICYDLAGKARPTEFATKAGTKQFLAVYKREKP